MVSNKTIEDLNRKLYINKTHEDFHTSLFIYKSMIESIYIEDNYKLDFIHKLKILGILDEIKDINRLLSLIMMKDNKQEENINDVYNNVNKNIDERLKTIDEIYNYNRDEVWE